MTEQEAQVEEKRVGRLGVLTCHPGCVTECGQASRSPVAAPSDATPTRDNDRCPNCNHHMNWADGYGYVCSKRGGCGNEYEVSDEAAPSDTDLLTDLRNIRAIWQERRYASSRTPVQAGDLVATELGRVIDSLSRTSQPVQVEVTDDMVERAARVLYEQQASSLRSLFAFVEMAAVFREQAHAALSAALGGGTNG